MEVATDELPVVVVDRQTGADSVMVLRLSACDGVLPQWTPGANIAVRTPAGPVRHYSLAGSPQDETWRIAVLREDSGAGGSVSMHDDVRVGTKLTVGAPTNNFRFEPRESCTFVAGGIGITPLIPMIEAADSAGMDWRLLYVGRRRSSMAFLEELVSRYGERVAVHPVDEGGRPDLATELSARHGAVYCCGPSAMLDELIAIGTARPDLAVHIEHFTPLEIDTSEDVTFEVMLARKGVVLDVPAHESILDVVDRAGANVLSSCREGTCGTCETTVLEGEIEHRDVVLTEEDREAGDVMLICVSRARCARLVLDL